MRAINNGRSPGFGGPGRSSVCCRTDKALIGAYGASVDIRTLSTLATLAVLSGCGSISLWNHPTNDEAQFAQDRYVCVNDGEQHAAGLDPLETS